VEVVCGEKTRKTIMGCRNKVKRIESMITNSMRKKGVQFNKHGGVFSKSLI